MARLLIWIFLSWQLSQCNNFIPKIPEQCQEQNICENVPNYPHEYMDSLIIELKEQGYIWRSYSDPLSLSKMNKKSSDSHNIVDICPSHVKITTPQAVKDETGQWQFVINNRDRPIQFIKAEVCNEHVVNRTCGETLQNTTISIKPLEGYSLLCRQQYLKYMLSCLDAHGKVVDIPIEAPSCCSCAVHVA